MTQEIPMAQTRGEPLLRLLRLMLRSTRTRRVVELKSDANKEGNDTLEAMQHPADSTDKVLGADSGSMNENGQIRYMKNKRASHLLMCLGYDCPTDTS